MHNQLALLGPDLRRLAALSVVCRSVSRDVTLFETQDPLATIEADGLGSATAAVVFLAGSENVVDLRLTLTRHSATPFIFLLPSMPPAPAVARIVRDAGGEILGASESDIVIAATLIQLLGKVRQTA